MAMEVGEVPADLLARLGDPRVTPPPRMTRVGGGYLRTPANGQPTAPPQAPRWDLT